MTIILALQSLVRQKQGIVFMKTSLMALPAAEGASAMLAFARNPWRTRAALAQQGVGTGFFGLNGWQTGGAGLIVSAVKGKLIRPINSHIDCEA